jgi:hypothetical protein
MYLCYGDDSINEGIIAYIIIGLKKQDLNSFVSTFKGLKMRHGLNKDTIFHSRQLFNGSYRKKNIELKHLDLDKIKRLSNEIVDLCISYRMPQPILSCAEKKQFPSKLAKKQRSIKNVKLDEKQGLHMLKNHCLLKLFDLFEKDESQFRFYSDKLGKNDKCSKNALSIGGTKKRAKMPNLILPRVISGKEEKIFRIPQLNYEDAPFKEMYEIADLFVYTSTKAICKQYYNDKDFFLALYKMINPIRVLNSFSLPFKSLV